MCANDEERAKLAAINAARSSYNRGTRQEPNPYLDAHARLSSLLKRKTGADVDPMLLRLFIKAHWSKVSKLAHEIHED